MDLIPTDLIQNEICKYLNLQTLIRARGICRKWRLAMDNSSAISDTRRGLLNVYLKLIENPAFIESRHLYRDLEPLDREKHLDLLGYLLEKDEKIPEQYKTWVREWPEKAIFDDLWPHLHRCCGNSNITAEYDTHFGAYQFRDVYGTTNQIYLKYHSEKFGTVRILARDDELIAKNWVKYLEEIAETFPIDTYCYCSEESELKYEILSWSDIRAHIFKRYQDNMDLGAAHINEYESNINKILRYL